MVMQGEELRPDQMMDVYRQSWTSRQEKIKFFNGDNELSLLNRAEQLLTVFHDSFNPEVTILGVEEFFAVDLDDVPPLQGYIDLIEQSPSGRIAVVDLKTASRKSSENAAHGNLQLTAYALGAESLGFDPDELLLRLDVLVKTKIPDFVRYETTRTPQQRDRFIKTAKQVWNGIAREVWFPNEDWHCTQCPFAGPCNEW
jgi:putative RecB family exonuclease